MDIKSGELINNISASDLKGITQQTFFKLETPIHQLFLNQSNKLPPVTVTKEATLEGIDTLYSILSSLLLYPVYWSGCLFFLSYILYLLSYPILSYPILSYPILSYPILSLSYPPLPIRFDGWIWENRSTSSICCWSKQNPYWRDYAHRSTQTVLLNQFVIQNLYIYIS